MAERREAAEIAEPGIAHRPRLAERGLQKTPATHALLVGIAGESRVGLLPLARSQRLLPDRLPFGSDDAVGTVLFELFTIAAVDQRVVVIGRHFQYERQPFGRQRTVAALKLARSGRRLVPVLF